MNGYQEMGVKCQSEGKNSTTGLPSLKTILFWIWLCFPSSLSWPPLWLWLTYSKQLKTGVVYYPTVERFLKNCDSVVYLYKMKSTEVSHSNTSLITLTSQIPDHYSPKKCGSLEKYYWIWQEISQQHFSWLVSLMPPFLNKEKKESSRLENKLVSTENDQMFKVLCLIREQSHGFYILLLTWHLYLFCFTQLLIFTFLKAFL